MDVLMGLVSRQLEYERLFFLEHLLGSARLKGEKRCVQCGFCCRARSCIPTPDELVRIAEFLEFTPRQLIQKYYVIDRNSFERDYFVKPAGSNVLDLVGDYVPSGRTFNEGRCVFFVEHNMCRIHPVRPLSARIQRCWVEDKSEVDELNARILSSWKGGVLKNRFGFDGAELEARCDAMADV